MKFNNVELTEETILATRKHVADIAQACIDDAVSGKTKVNDLENYCQWRNGHIKDGMAGFHDHTFAFLQRAYWIQTGEMIGLLPNPT